MYSLVYASMIKLYHTLLNNANSLVLFSCSKQTTTQKVVKRTLLQKEYFDIYATTVKFLRRSQQTTVGSTIEN